MKFRELIEALKVFDPELLVTTSDLDLAKSLVQEGSEPCDDQLRLPGF